MSILPFTIYHGQRSTRSRQHRFIISSTIVVGMAALTFLTLGVTFGCGPSPIEEHDRAYEMPTNVVIRSDGQVFKYDRYSPVVFVSGTNLSGSELLRDILNTHPDIRCTNDRYFMRIMLAKQKAWFNHKNESVRLAEAGITKELMETAMGASFLEIMARSGPPVKYLCNEDVHSGRFGLALSAIFSKSKFILVVRDPMHYAHLKVQDHNLERFNETLFMEYLREWDGETQQLRSVCNVLNLSVSSVNKRPSRCMIVNYEQLFLRPASVMLPVLRFVVGDESLTHIPRSVWSSLQRGTNEDLLEWVKHVPEGVAETVRNMGFSNLMRFKYLKLGYPPNYHLLEQL